MGFFTEWETDPNLEWAEEAFIMHPFYSFFYVEFLLLVRKSVGHSSTGLLGEENLHWIRGLSRCMDDLPNQLDYLHGR